MKDAQVPVAGKPYPIRSISGLPVIRPKQGADCSDRFEGLDFGFGRLVLLRRVDKHDAGFSPIYRGGIANLLPCRNRTIRCLLNERNNGARLRDVNRMASVNR
jgi:hypothetical protein